MLNRSELLNGQTDVEYFHPAKFRLEPDLLVAVLGSLVYSGDIVLAITGDKIDSGKIDDGAKSDWRRVSKLGARRPVLNDLSAIGGFIAYNFNASTNVHTLELETEKVSKRLEFNHGWMYQTLHHPTEEQIKRGIKLVSEEEKPNLSEIGQSARINYTVWSDVFSCPECAHEIVFFEVALDHDKGGVRDDLTCPSCKAKFGKKEMGRFWSSKIDPALKEQIKQAKQVPVLINYTVGRQRHEKRPDEVDLALLRKVEAIDIRDRYPSIRMAEGAETRRNDPIGVTHTHHFYTHRNLICLSALRAQCVGDLGRQLLFGLARYSTWRKVHASATCPKNAKRSNRGNRRRHKGGR